MLLGTFKKTETNGFTGTIRTLTFTAELAIEPNREKKTDKAPDYRIIADDLEVGGAWMKTSDAGNAYLSVTLDDPTLARSHRLRAGQERHRARLQPRVDAPPPARAKPNGTRLRLLTPRRGGGFRRPVSSAFSFMRFYPGEFL